MTVTMRRFRARADGYSGPLPVLDAVICRLWQWTAPKLLLRHRLSDSAIYAIPSRDDIINTARGTEMGGPGQGEVWFAVESLACTVHGTLACVKG
jgi:hypothetical protein